MGRPKRKAKASIKKKKEETPVEAPVVEKTTEENKDEEALMDQDNTKDQENETKAENKSAAVVNNKMSAKVRGVTVGRPVSGRPWKTVEKR